MSGSAGHAVGPADHSRPTRDSAVSLRRCREVSRRRPWSKHQQHVRRKDARSLRQYCDVEVENAWTCFRRPGPVLVLRPSGHGLARLARQLLGPSRLCVASWNRDEIGPWMAAVQLELPSTADVRAGIVNLRPEIESAMVSASQLMPRQQHSAVFKRDVVGTALGRLHDGGHRLDGRQA